jgi:hypothetical protein
MSIIIKGYTTGRAVTLGYGPLAKAIEEAVEAIGGRRPKVEKVKERLEELCVTVSLVAVNNKDLVPPLTEELCKRFEKDVFPRVKLKNIEVLPSHKDSERIVIKVTCVKTKKKRR